MSQLEKRLTQMEATERTRLFTEIDALLEAMTDEELTEFAGPITDRDRSLAELSDEELTDYFESNRRAAPIGELQDTLADLKEWLADHRAPMQGIAI